MRMQISEDRACSIGVDVMCPCLLHAPSRHRPMLTLFLVVRHLIDYYYADVVRSSCVKMFLVSFKGIGIFTELLM